MILNTELHRHLEASLRPQTIAELSGVYTSGEQVKKQFVLKEPLSSLKEVLDRFLLFQKCLSSPEIFSRITCESIEDAKTEGIEKLELRYSPSFSSELSKISWQEVLNAIVDGVKRGVEKTNIQVGLICTVSRDYGVHSAHETIDFAIENKKHFIGVDLAGNEVNFPCRMFQDPFKKALAANLPVTIHAGEACGAENVWEAIDLLGATRIGHGIRSIDDKVLLKRLSQDKILLEVCPTSNYITGAVSKIEEHPLPRLLDAGVWVSVGTDDPSIFGKSLPEETEVCKTRLSMRGDDLKKINEFSQKKSFLLSKSA